MHIFKKICAVLLCIATALPCMPAYAASGEVNESFESASVGSEPSGWLIDKASGDGQAAVYGENGNNSLMMRTAGKSYITADYQGGSFSGNVILEAKLLIKQGGGDAAIRITDKNGTVAEPVVFSSESVLSVYDGGVSKTVSDYSMNRWYRVALAVNTASGIYDMYLVGEKAMSNLALPAKGSGGKSMDYSGGITAIGANVYQGSSYGYTNILFDDFRIYNATEPKRDEQFETINLMSVADSTNISESSTGKYGFKNGQAILMLPDASAVALDERFLGYDRFNDDFVGRVPRYFVKWNHYTKGNKSTVEYLADSNNEMNKAVRVEILTASSSDEQYIFNDSPIGEDFTVEASWYAEELVGTRYFQMTASPNSVKIISLEPDGVIKACDGSALATYSAKEWVDVAVAVHWNEKTCDYYINDELVAEGIGYTYKGENFNSMRVGVVGGGVSWFDNFYIYKGTEKIDTKALPDGTFAIYKNLLDDDADVLKRLTKGTIAMKIDSSVAYVDGKRTTVDKEVLSATPKLANEKTVVPVRFILENLGFSVSWNEEQKVITATDGTRNITIHTKDGVMYSDNDDGQRRYECLLENGRCLIPVRVLANWVGKRIYWNDDGICILGDNAQLFDSEKDAGLIDKLYRMMTFTRPTGKQIISDIKKKYPNWEHNRVYLTDERIENIMSRYNAGDEEIIKWRDNYIASARRSIGTEALDYDIYDGKRLLDISRTMEGRFIMYALAFRLTGDTDMEIFEQCFKEMKKIAEYPNWNETHFLDTAEMCRGFAIAYDTFYDVMSEEQRELCVKTIKEKALIPALFEYRYGNGATHSEWANSIGNWNPVCNSCMMIGALAIAESDEALAGEILESALIGMETNLVNFAPDGAWHEGPGYWHYTIEFIHYGLDSLECATGSFYNYLDVAGFGGTANYYFAMMGPGGTFNYGDMTQQYVKSPELYWFAKAMNKPELAAVYKDMETEFGFGANSVTARLNYDKAFTESADVSQMPYDMIFRKYWVGSLRSSWKSSDATYIGFQGGRPNIGHSQMSIGNFVLDAMGERWAIDLGYDDYNIGYLGIDENSRSWWIYRKSTEGHNCFLINPDDKHFQVYNSDSPIIDFKTGAMGGYSVVDLTPAYARNAKLAKRGFRLDRTTEVVTVQDEIDMKYNDSEYYWFMHTEADINISQDGKSAILEQNGKKLWVGIKSPQEAKFTVMDTKPLPSSADSGVRDKEAENEGVSKLAIHLTGLDGHNTISVSMVGLKDFTMTEPAVDIPEVTPIEEWTIPEGELVRPTLETLTLDGAVIEDFDGENKYNYTVKLPFGTEMAPTVEASGDGEITVTQAQDLPGAASVKVSKPGMADAYYIVTYRVQPLLDKEPEGMQRINVKKITASAEPQAENPAVASMDGDYITRWAANGEHWIMYEFDKVETLSAFMTAWISGDQRLAYFDMQTSMDGTNWTTHFAGESSGETLGPECIMIDDTKAKYARFKVHGSSQGSWSSLSEVAFYRK